jgi:hypothetical protein
MKLGIGIGIGLNRRRGVPPVITRLTPAEIGPYVAGDLPNDAYVPGTYASTAGAIDSVGAAWTLNGTAWDEVTALAEGDEVRLTETPTDDATPPNSRPFNYGPEAVAAAPPFTLASITAFSVGPQDGADLPVSITIVEGSDPPQNLFIVAVPDGAPAPSAAQIAAGQDSTGAPAPAAVSVTGITSGNVNLDIDPTPADGAYDFYAVVVDSEGRPSNVASALGVAWAEPPSGPVELFADNFNRANASTLGSDWILRQGGWKISANRAETTGEETNTAVVSSSVAAVPSDQYARCTLVFGGTGNLFLGPVVRHSETGTITGYVATNDASEWRIIEIGAGIIATVAGDSAAGDVVELRAVGTTVTLIVNSVEILSVTNSNVTAGQPGIRSFGPNKSVDNFSCGSL